MKRTTLITLALLSTFAMADDGAEMEAFNFGIESTMLTLQHEKSIANKPIEKGYCITVNFGENGAKKERSKSFWAIKLESLALHLKNPKPQYLEYRNQNGDLEQTLCFAFVQGSENEAAILLKKIKGRYPKITKYNPKIFRITNPAYFNRAVPSLGQWVKDKSSAVSLLSTEVKSLKKKLRKKEKKLKAIQNSLLRIAGGDQAKKATYPRKIVTTKAPLVPVKTKKHNIVTSPKSQTTKVVPVSKGSRILVIKK